jgi:type IV pilus assembly protein PilQ
MTASQPVGAHAPMPTAGRVHACTARARGGWAALLFALASLCGGAALAEQTAGNALESIDFSTLPGERVQITLTLSADAPQPTSFATDNPARIALDLPGTTNAVAGRAQTIGVGVARSINIVEAQGRTRVVLNLVQMVPYETRTEGNKVYVLLDGAATAAAAAAPAPATLGTRPAVLRAAGAGGVRNIDFRRGERGEARVVVQLADPSIPVDVRHEGGKLMVEFFNATLPENLERRLDVSDFATPVRSVDSFAHGNNVRVVVTPVGEYEHLAYQAQDVFTLEVKPLTREEIDRAQRERPTYTGERLSLNFQSIETRAVLQLIADFTGLNVVVSDSVAGNLTLRLQNVPWDQALDIILKTRGLGMRQTDNVVLIAPAEEIAQRERQEMEASRSVEELAPLRSEFVQINYAKASDIAALLKSPDNQLLSERGNATSDERTNTLLVQDTAEKLDDVRRLVARLDVPVRQVLIESRIVIASDDFSRELGVRFGATAVSTGRDTVGVTGSGPGAGELVQNPRVGDRINPPPYGDRLNVNLPIASAPAGGSIGLAILGANYLVDLELTALQAEGRGEVISNPRVITANQREATIKQGFEVPYVTPSTVGAPATVSFKEALLSLTVTPQITPDENIIMDLAVNRDNPDFTRSVQGNPPLEKREIITSVAVRNGETVVLGGVFEHSRQELNNKVPLLGDLPVLGVLFRNKLNLNEKRELLVFVTPKIVREGMGAQ